MNETYTGRLACLRAKRPKTIVIKLVTPNLMPSFALSLTELSSGITMPYFRSLEKVEKFTLLIVMRIRQTVTLTRHYIMSRLKGLRDGKRVKIYLFPKVSPV